MKLRLNLFQVRKQLQESTLEGKDFRASLTGDGRITLDGKGSESRWFYLSLEDAAKLRDWLNEKLGSKTDAV